MELWLDEMKATFILNFIEDDRWMYLVKGLGITLTITSMALLLGIAIGVVCAMIRAAHDQAGKKLRAPLGRALLELANAVVQLYVTVVRGTPVMVQLLLGYFVIFVATTNTVVVASLVFGINSGAYITEIIRSGIMSVDRGQFEAGASLGLGYVPTMRFIIIPQAFKVVLPTLANEFIALLKETAVCGYIGLTDLTRAGDIIRGGTFTPFMPLMAVALIYLTFVLLLSALFGKIEKKLRVRG